MKNVNLKSTLALAISLISSVGFSAETINLKEFNSLKSEIKCIKEGDIIHDSEVTEYYMKEDDSILDGFIDGAKNIAIQKLEIELNNGDKKVMDLKVSAKSESVLDGGKYVSATSTYGTYITLNLLGKFIVVPATALVETVGHSVVTLSKPNYSRAYNNQVDTLMEVSNIAAEGVYYGIAYTQTADNRLYSLIKVNGKLDDALSNIPECK